MLFRSYLPLDVKQVGGATRADYLGSADQIAPVADPNISSDTMRLQMALQLKAAAAATPGYDHDAVEMRFLKALRVDAPQAVFPGTKGAPPPKDPNLQIMETKVQGDLAGKKMDNETKQAQLQLKQREMDQDLQKWMIELEEERDRKSTRLNSSH